MLRRNSKNIFISILTGLGIGYLAGILTAKQSGKQTRGDIKDYTEKSIDSSEEKIGKLYSDLSEIIKTAEDKIKKGGLSLKGNLSKATDRARLTKIQVKEILSALRKGQTNNKDLQKTMASAKTAIKNLKTYLKN
ncbi:MAG TPA: YtxH domain-containing protein [Candidatus Saccharimonadia bacterium]|nr:YtxH domain-containing protein [Candidatus Saccharimonadia bacterium]